MMAHSTALFLVNGNHEQAAAIHLNGTPDNPAIYAGKARNLYYPLPVPDDFYSGDTEQVDFLGLRRDYYACTWGDATLPLVSFLFSCYAPVRHHRSLLVLNGPGEHFDRRR